MSLDASAFIGPILVGTLINWLLLGTVVVQLYVFHHNQLKRKDPIWLRLLVYTVIILNLAETIFCTHLLWYYTVARWGSVDLFKERRLPWSGRAVDLVTTFVTLLVQFMYAWRIWTLSRHAILRALAYLAIALSVMQFGASLTALILGQEKHIDGPAPGLYFNIFAVQFVGAFVSDTLITVCMLALLFSARAQSFWSSSRTLYDRLIIVTVSTDLLTAITSGVALALLVRTTTSNNFFAPGIFMGKLYANGLLATLNDRFFRDEDILNDTDTSGSRSIFTSSFAVSREPRRPAFDSGNNTIDICGIRDLVQRNNSTHSTSTRISVNSRAEHQSGDGHDEFKLTSCGGRPGIHHEGVAV